MDDLLWRRKKDSAARRTERLHIEAGINITYARGKIKQIDEDRPFCMGSGRKLVAQANDFVYNKNVMDFCAGPKPLIPAKK